MWSCQYSQPPFHIIWRRKRCQVKIFMLKNFLLKGKVYYSSLTIPKQENGYMYKYGCIISLYTWHYHKIVNHLQYKVKSFLKIPKYITDDVWMIKGLLVLHAGEGNGTHSSTLAWKIPWTEEPGGLQSMGSLRVRHNWATSLSLFTFMHWSRKWQPTPVFLPGESQGRGSLVGCRLWGRTELDTTEVT